MKNIFLASSHLSITLHLQRLRTGCLDPEVPTIDIYSSGNQNCAVFDNESTYSTKETSLKCWGYNLYGQLGYGNSTYLGDNASELGTSLGLVNLGTNIKITQLSAGTLHFCVV